MSREDNWSRTEADAARAEYWRTLDDGPDNDPCAEAAEPPYDIAPPYPCREGCGYAWWSADGRAAHEKDCDGSDPWQPIAANGFCESFSAATKKYTRGAA